jgi:nitrate reductase assembly molybdenum cofactor insertion protein NarJ
MAADALNARLVADLLRPPTGDYLAQLEAAARVSPGEASRHFGLFADRVRDLTTEELQEVYRESFAPAETAALAAAAEGLALPAPATEHVLRRLQDLLPPLEARRNPFALLFKATCCYLLACDRKAPPAPDPAGPSTESAHA